MGFVRCCVPQCTNREAQRHYIPADERIKDLWLERINNPKLFNQSRNILRGKAVCSIHFENICKEGKKLKNFALPTLHLPDFDGENSEENCFAFPPKNVIETPPKMREILRNFGLIKPMERNDEKDAPPKKKLCFNEEPGTSQFVDPSPGTSGASHFVNASPGTSGAVITPKQKEEIQACRRTRNKNFDVSKKIQNLQRLARRRKIVCSQTKKKLRLLTANQSNINNIFKNLNTVTINFMTNQMKNQKKKSRGRRYTTDDKILALSLSKKSGKGYRYLSSLFSLPSRKTLSKLLQQIPFSCGINKKILNNLQKAVSKLGELDKYCVLMFDEMSIQPGLQYNPSKDCVDGFVDFGGPDRRAAFADHALVFMIKGIKRKWKQVVCVSFCESSTPTPVLKRLIKEIIRSIRNIGLSVVATICDQGSTNQASINALLHETHEHCLRNNIDNRYQGYLVDNLEVIHIYDCPHLLKNIRNNLLTKDLHFTQDGIIKKASWSHIVDLYRMDREQGPYSQFIKLTDEHILPDRIKKMKVKNCTQVFSHTVATAMHARAKIATELDSSSSFYIDPKSAETADLLLKFDQLFDSVNGSLLSPPDGKQLRSVVSKKSPHVAFWNSSIPFLQSLYYTTTDNPKPTTIPSIKNWIFSIRSFLYIWKLLQQKGFKYMSPRVFNQDPIENFFSCVRSYGSRNPTCSSFISTTKSLVVNNFTSPYSVGANCEEDESEGLLDNLKSFIEEKVENEICPIVNQPIYPPNDTQYSDTKWDLATPYVAGVVIKKIFKKYKCVNCKNRMGALSSLVENTLIRERENKPGNLMHPSSQFLQLFKKTTNSIVEMLPRYILHYSLKKELVQTIDTTPLLSLFCSDHLENHKSFISISVNIVVYMYLRNITNLLNGKDLRHKDQDPLHKMAFAKYSKKMYKRH